MLKSVYQSLATACSMVDCCFGLRPCHQAVFPCIRSCSYGDRKVFYNYDGTETVEPLVDYFKPTNTPVKRNMIRGESGKPTCLEISLFFFYFGYMGNLLGIYNICCLQHNCYF